VRRTTILIALALCAAGCGGAADVRDAAKPQAAACPAGTEAVKAREVIGPLPRRYEVEPPERPKPVEDFVAELRREMGKAYRSHDVEVIYRGRELEGTVVVVINTHEGNPEDVVAGAKAAERDDGIQGERLDIDGREGRLQHASDGSYVAMAPARDCSFVILIDTSEPRVRESASIIGARG
jgi:hypothetical protein